MLTEMKKGDRETMARMVEDLCRSKGATVSRLEADLHGPKEVVLEIEMGQARVRIDFDGTKGIAEDRDVYCMPWNTLLNSKARMTNEFGSAVGADVNPHHRAKCMGFAYGIDELIARLSSTMDCISSGRAFEHDLNMAA